MTGTWPSGWATGDLTLAAQYAKGIGCISDQTLVGSAATVDVASIVASYAHLLVVAYARGDTAATSTNLMLRLNGDTAANYDFQTMTGNTAGAFAAEAFAQALGASVGLIPANTAGANLFGAFIFFIPHYAGSASNKLALSVSSVKTGTTSGSMTNYLRAGFWRSNAAINQITLFPAAGNLVAGTRLSVYGMGA